MGIACLMPTAECPGVTIIAAGIKIPGIVLAGLWSPNCLLIRSALKIHRPTGATLVPILAAPPPLQAFGVDSKDVTEGSTVRPWHCFLLHKFVVNLI